MKIVINKCYGGFNLPYEVKKLYGIEYADDIKRTDQRLVKWVEENLNNKVWNEDEEEYISKCDFDYSSLRVVEIPDEATDFYINEYDGDEEVIYVLDGKIKFTS